MRRIDTSAALHERKLCPRQYRQPYSATRRRSGNHTALNGVYLYRLSFNCRIREETAGDFPETHVALPFTAIIRRAGLKPVRKILGDMHAAGF